MDEAPADAQRCAVLARAAATPMAGTAPSARGWICVEQRGAWPRSVEAHPEPAVAALAARAAALGWKLVLIRRPGREAGASVRVFCTDVAASRTVTFTVEGPSALDDVAPGTERGEVVPGGMLLVCTHGRRDRCCALEGRGLAAAVAQAGEADVWECSHLGGHRFAPTALVLPTGYLYGRLDIATAVAAGKAAGLGEVEGALCRGRSLWSPQGQVAELAVRGATGLRDVAALTVEPHAGPVQLVTGPNGQQWTVAVAEVATTPRPASCGASALPSWAWHAAPPRLISAAACRTGRG